MGAAGTRPSLRPRYFRGQNDSDQLGARAACEREALCPDEWQTAVAGIWAALSAVVEQADCP